MTDNGSKQGSLWPGAASDTLLRNWLETIDTRVTAEDMDISGLPESMLEELRELGYLGK